MKFQPDFGHPSFQGGEDFPGLPLCHTVHHSVVGVTFEFHGRELPFQPFVERIMHEEVREDG